MATRIASAAVALPIVFFFVWWGAPWFTILAAIAAAVGATELSAMARGRTISGLVAAAGAAAIVVFGHFGGGGLPWTYLVTVTALAVLVWLLWGKWQIHRVRLLVPTVGASLYAGGLLFHAPLLRALEDGRQWVFFLLLVTFATDTAAFLVGRAIGKRPLAPSISPSKTWEGAVGGTVAALGVAVASASALGLGASVAEALLLGALLAVTGQVGDLAESRLKRVARVKDSGRLMPGHGGLLDRLDSIVLNLVVVYYFVLWEIQQKGLLS